MLTSKVVVLKSCHGISVKCSRYRDTGPTDPSLINITRYGYMCLNTRTVGFEGLNGRYIFFKVIRRRVPDIYCWQCTWVPDVHLLYYVLGHERI